MNLPRNAYARHCAREAARCMLRGRPYSVDSAWVFRERAYTWAPAWWCPVEVGEAITAGEMTAKAVGVALLYRSAIGMILGSALFAVYAIVYTLVGWAS